jgi:hypothetical protein
MAGGSHTPDADDDRQCQHCGLWFSSRGVLSHEETCDLADHDTRLEDLEDPQARMRADLSPHPEDGEESDVDAAGPDSLDNVIDATDHAGAGDDVQEASAEPEAATDGGPRDLPTFDEDAGADDLEDVTESSGDPSPSTGDNEAETCPNCDAGEEQLAAANVVADVIGIPDDHDVREHDLACLACATVDEESVHLEAFDERGVAA